MIARSIPTSFTAAILTISHVHGYYVPPPLVGHDFDFSASWPSGLTISTSSPPKDVLPAKEIAFIRPTITLSDPGSTGRDERYTSFLEISYISPLSLDDVIFAFSWVKTNLTVLENGTLDDSADDSLHIYYMSALETSEVRNATLHVWKQNDELMSALNDERFTFMFQLIRTWANTTDYLPKEFSRTNVDFKVRNETGEYKGGVDDDGALIPGYVLPSTSSATGSPTATPSTGAGSGSVSASTTAGAGPTETPNAASRQAFLTGWATTISGLLVFALGSLAI